VTGFNFFGFTMSWLDGFHRAVDLVFAIGGGHS
jgi:hypothetical protein